MVMKKNVTLREMSQNPYVKRSYYPLLHICIYMFTPCGLILLIRDHVHLSTDESIRILFVS